ncbi:MAG: hypothetical protein NZ893_03035 [Candidatus Aenigmarchaeota archaeon]|nr:hypothetical protein [Candidatus Aenigmarchaeota archaeon]
MGARILFEEPTLFRILTDEALLNMGEEFQLICQKYSKLQRRLKKSKHPIYTQMVYYRKTLRLYEEGVEPYNISKFLGIRFSTILSWIKGHHPLSSYIVSEFNYHFGYTLGAAIGDGAVSYPNIIFSWLKDEDFVDAIADSVKSMGLKTWVWKKRNHQVAFCNAIFAQLVLLGKHSAQTLLPLLSSSKEVAIGVVSGFFDAEGRSGWGKKYLYDAPRASNTKIEIIHLIKGLLDYLGIHSTILKSKNKEFISPKTNKKYRPKSEYIYSVRIKRCCVKRFYKLIGFRIKRKQEELSKLVQTRFRYICPI